MNEKKQPEKDAGQEQKDPNFRKRTDLPGQNPKANDDPSQDLYHDENRKP